MLTMILSTNYTLSYSMLDPGAIMFGFLLIVFGASLSLVFLLKHRPAVSWPLLSLLIIIEACLLSVVALELGGGSSGHFTVDTVAGMSELFFTHRWLLLVLPLSLIASAITN